MGNTSYTVEYQNTKLHLEINDTTRICLEKQRPDTNHFIMLAEFQNTQQLGIFLSRCITILKRHRNKNLKCLKQEFFFIEGNGVYYTVYIQEIVGKYFFKVIVSGTSIKLYNIFTDSVILSMNCSNYSALITELELAYNNYNKV